MNYSIYYRSMVFTLFGFFLLPLRSLPLICGAASDISLHWGCCSLGRAFSHTLRQGLPWSRFHSLNMLSCKSLFLQDHEKTQDAETQYFSLLCSDSSLHGKQWKMETQSQSQPKDLKDFINLSNIFHRDISENEMRYCKNFLPGNKSKCRAHIFRGREEIWEGKSLQYSLRKYSSSHWIGKDINIHKVISTSPWYRPFKQIMLMS